MKFPGLVQVVNLLAVATMSTEVSAQTPPPVDKWPSLGGRIVTPNSEGWSAATDRWNAYGAPTFAAAVVPKNANEVALAVSANPPCFCSACDLAHWTSAGLQLATLG